jgi:FkbM family methyltransferase
MAESIPARVRHAANRLLRPFGLHLARAERAFDMDGLLARAAARGTPVATWIDVGASDGSWSLLAQRHFPRARFLLFEPLAERQPALDALHARHGFEIAAAAAGARAGRLSFHVGADLDGSGVAAPGAGGARTVPVAAIDDVIAARGLTGPFALKLDTHGHELPVLEGAARTLTSASLLVIEAYTFTLAPGSLRFHELCAWLEARNFRCCDLADPMRRPGDGALWQMDLAFAPADSPVFEYNRYT